MSYNEADTRSKIIDPKLRQAGWNEERMNREYPVKDGRIKFDGKKGRREQPEYADYLLRYTSSLPIAIVEAKREELSHLEGVKQAKEYAAKLGIRFAYATNGHEIEFIDLKKRIQQTVQRFHSPQELWQMYNEELKIVNPTWIKGLTENYFEETGLGMKRLPRYYQEKAVNKAIEAVISGQKRVLINMATGTGKTFTSVQMVYKLWKSNVAKKILFIVDRNILADQAFKDFDAAFEKGACYRLSPKDKQFNLGRDIYFGIYQTLVGNEETGKIDRYKEFDPTFFDLIVIDECHRGGANEEGNWFRLLEYFSSAVQIGLTATPKRDESVDTYQYFGNPVMTYSLKNGIEDGYLAPYVVKRVRMDIDKGLNITKEERDVRGEIVKKGTYSMSQFERIISVPERTRQYAFHLMLHLLQTDVFGKTIVFCVNQNHALDMAKYVNEAYELYAAANNLPEIENYAVRITSNDKESDGKYHNLEKFQNLEAPLPVVVTTSKLLTTGVDVKNLKNVVIFNNIGSMAEFKQIIGRGTRIYDSKNSKTEKLGFTILEYGNYSIDKFKDADFDGIPENEETEHIPSTEPDGNQTIETPDNTGEIKEYITYRMSERFLRDQVAQLEESLLLLGQDGETLSPKEYTQYQCDKIRTLYTDDKAFKKAWMDLKTRKKLFEEIEKMGIKVDILAELFAQETGQKDVDVFDIILYLAFGYQFKRKSERVKEVKKNHQEFFKHYPEKAQEVLDLLFNIYEKNNHNPITVNANTFKTSIFSTKQISFSELGSIFGSKEKAFQAIQFVQTSLYEELDVS